MLLNRLFDFGNLLYIDPTAITTISTILFIFIAIAAVLFVAIAVAVFLIVFFVVRSKKKKAAIPADPQDQAKVEDHSQN